MKTVTTPVRFERAEKNQQFGNNASLESVEGLLRNLAAKCFARVSAMGLGMTFDDVKQEMYVSYVKASHKWNPQGGALFSTYCATVCLNNFNAVIKKAELERAKLGLPSVEDFHLGSGRSNFKQIDGCDAAAIAASDWQPDPTGAPEMRLEGSQEMNRRLNGLSKSARLFIGLLLQCERQGQHVAPVRLQQVARMAKLEGPELRRVKLEILNTYGVQWH